MAQMTTNNPELWRKLLPYKSGDAHKYDYGHALIYAAPELTGATNLAAQACARTGTGLVSVIAPHNGDLYRTILPAHILVRDDENLKSKTISAKLYGPGGISVAPDFAPDIPCVLDADALRALPETLSDHYVLTPHQGEFDRAFPNVTGTREERVLQAANNIGCYIILKGAQTLIASPDGQIVMNDHASPWLATAGSGDVLAGLVTGLLAQNMPVFEACCAAIWIHGDAALRSGAYCVATDLIDQIPIALSSLANE